MKKKLFLIFVAVSIVIYCFSSTLFLETTASVLISQDRIEAGKQLLAICLAIHPQDNYCLSQGARAYFMEGNFEEAIKIETQVIANIPNYWGNYMDRGDMFRISAYQIAEDGDTQQALEYMEKAHKDYSDAIELSPNSSELYSKRAQVYFDTAHYDDALKDTEQALLINPNQGEAYVLRALTYWIGFEDIPSACYNLKMGQNLFKKQGDKEGLAVIMSYHDLLSACELSPAN